MPHQPRLDADAVPIPVRDLLERLAQAGHSAVLVGGCVRDLIEDRRVRDFDVATAATPEVVLRLFPRAVPIGLRHGTVMVPSPAGPIDVTRFRHGPDLADDLARRDFTVNALAWALEAEAPIDLHGGLADLRAGRLRAVGDPAARLAEDPLRAVRAVRLMAERGWQPTGDLQTAMSEAAPSVAGVAAERLRAELSRILIAPEAGNALRLLRATGIEEALVPGIDAQAAARVDALPRTLDERLAAWLIGTPARRVLARLRFPNATSHYVARVLSEHPVQDRTNPARPPMVRRLLHRFSPAEVDGMIDLARAVASVDGTSTRRIEALRTAVTEERSQAALALHREDLALDGAAVMAHLGTGPGPVVGEALRYLTHCVLEDPSENQPERLRARLEAWAGARR